MLLLIGSITQIIDIYFKNIHLEHTDRHTSTGKEESYRLDQKATYCSNISQPLVSDEIANYLNNSLNLINSLEQHCQSIFYYSTQV